ncbi:hypothetical protein DL96DRAFT_1474768 [Flagelloscypha sp. PMI_526]|nr:hypothetical protein DL96DRAFT_1474768 [Flagelloscypha sp. PMI_526]
MENSYEPTVALSSHENKDEIDPLNQTAIPRREGQLHDNVTVQQYSDKNAGAPISQNVLTSDASYAAKVQSTLNNPYSPFASRMDWEIARWGKLRGPSSTALTELLQIEGVAEKLGLSFDSSAKLNKIVDNKLPGRPEFRREEIQIHGEVFDLYLRDIIECIRSLWGEESFTEHLIFTPERHYSDPNKTNRLYHDMHTGKWWWATQKELDKTKPGATIVPIIISSDKTQVTVFRNKSAYPVYMTLGNLPKAIRRKPSRQAQVLLAYLPTDKLDHITNKASRRRALANLFHHCMTMILEPLKEAGINGIELTSGDGAVRRCHPIYACFVGDYPEQILVTCTKTGECPICDIDRNALGEGCLGTSRDLDAILSALQQVDRGPEFVVACHTAGIKPIQRPFWQNLPYLNIYQSITPDILHQLYQGVVKHVVQWVRAACGDEEIDARCRRLPPNHTIRIFMKGISKLSRVSGTEHGQICSFILGVVIGIPLPDGHQQQARLVQSLRSLLDFLFLAQYPIHSTATLNDLSAMLEDFHRNKSIFEDLGIREGFNIPKLHFTGHYVHLIQLFGTTDNYNTEATERLHIDQVKDAYRATNRKDEYPQMTLWLSRKEKIQQHHRFIERRLQSIKLHHIGELPAIPERHQYLPEVTPLRELRLAKRPAASGVRLHDLASVYGVHHFGPAFSRYLVLNFLKTSTRFTQGTLDTAAWDLSLPFDRISVYHRLKFVQHDPYNTPPSTIVDSVHIQPARQDTRGQEIPSRFDTVLINVDGKKKRTGLNGYQVAQVRCVFQLPKAVLTKWFSNSSLPRPPEYLAYVEWFSEFPSHPGSGHFMYPVSRSFEGVAPDRERVVSIVDVQDIRCSVHLFPQFGPTVPRAWKSSTVLDECEHFYLNDFLSRYHYFTLS